MTKKTSNKPVNVLLVEDEPVMTMLIKQGLALGDINKEIFEVDDGIEALAFLRKEGKYSNSLTPDLIVLDLNLPKKDGREVLKEIKSDEALKHIPVVIMTVSRDEQDLLKSYKKGANAYIVKPTGLPEFVAAAKSIEDFWLKASSPPPSKYTDA